MHIVASPMAGTVARLLVNVGDTLESGQDLLILESMKMEIAIRAEVAGRVKAVRVHEGDFVDEGATLLEIE